MDNKKKKSKKQRNRSINAVDDLKNAHSEAPPGSEVDLSGIDELKQANIQDSEEFGWQQEMQSLRREIQGLVAKVELLQDRMDSITQQGNNADARLLELECRARSPPPPASPSQQDGLPEDLESKQAGAAASVVEKLAADNAELVAKLNKQSLVIRQLTNRQSLVSINGPVRVARLKGSSATPGGEVDRHATPTTTTTTTTPGKGIEQVGMMDDNYNNVMSKNLQQQVAAADNDKTREQRKGESSAIKEKDRAGVKAALTEPRIEQKQSDEDDHADAEGDEGQNGTGSVPFSDAPLLGAPIRVLSTVARFVSGADLVRKK